MIGSDSAAHYRKQASWGVQAIDFAGTDFRILPQKMSMCDRATLRAMQGCEKVHVGSTNSHLGAACSDQDHD